MNRSIRTAVAVAAMSAIAVSSAIPALAAAPGPKGTLTTVEYKQLVAEQAAFKKLRTNKHLTWNDIYAVCHMVGRSTDLSQSVRNNCDTGVGIDQSLTGFYSDIERCSALSTSTGTATTTTPTTTTTGTTTTATPTTTTAGLSQSDFKLLACMQPEYAVIARALKAVLSSQSTLRTQVLARDFTGRCRLTLAPSPRGLALLRHFAATAKQLAADVEQITKVADGSAPSSSVNTAQVQADSVSFATAGRNFEHITRPQNLAVCPHQ
jgi:hypothetical protein